MIMSFMDWKDKYMPGGVSKYTTEQKAAFKRLHDIDLDEEFEKTAKQEYDHYVATATNNDIIK